MNKRRFLRLMAGLSAAGSPITSQSASQYSSAKTTAMNSDNHYWMPEESDQHTRTFMQWPVNRVVHPDRVFLDMLQSAIADVANTISEFEPVVMLMDAQFTATARRLLGEGVEIWDIATDDLWCRDSGPVFLRDDTDNLAVCSFNFNGWGNRQVHDNDAKVAQRVAERLDLPLLDSGIVGESGGVESDGDGTLLAHESSWINTNRNTEDKPVVEQRLLTALGADKILWSPGIKDQDITDYHIDSLARFTQPGHVVIQLPDENPPHDAQSDVWVYAAYETYQMLQSATDAHERNINITVIPEPDNIRITSDDFVASYVNYYVCNGAVIAAQFGDTDTDAQALETLADLYPAREIVQLNVDPIGETGGGIHCATQQQPAV